MKYDFDKLIERRGTACFKWDLLPDDDVLPLWVADMDFATAPAILQALHKRVDHGVFGYVKVPEEYYRSVINWYERRHHWTMQRDWMLYTIGVVPALAAIVKALTQPGDKVAVLTPVYNCFFTCITNNGCQPVELPLINRQGYCTIDYDRLDQALADEKTKVLIFCNPHNPGGRVWTREELRCVAEICLRHGVKVIDDQIHCEFVFPGHEFIPMASLSPEILGNTITCCSPSKAFNTAGLQMANIVCADAETRERIDRAINVNEVCDVNPFGFLAVMAAYDQSEDWLDQVVEYIYQNWLMLKNFFAENLPQLTLSPLEGTYLAWVDCRPLGKHSADLSQLLLEQGRVQVSSGEIYGQIGDGFIRINMACPRSRLEEVLRRIASVLKPLLK